MVNYSVVNHGSGKGDLSKTSSLAPFATRVLVPGFHFHDFEILSNSCYDGDIWGIPNKYPLYMVYMGLFIKGPPSQGAATIFPMKLLL